MVQQVQHASSSPSPLRLPSHRDPVAWLALVALLGVTCYLMAVMPNAPAAQAEAQIVIATPTIGILPTAAPTAEPIVVQAAPTFAPVPTPAPAAPTAEPIVVEVVVVATPTDAPVALEQPTAAPITALPAGSIVILPTPTQTRQEFIASFGPTPDPAAKCAFVGCLHTP